jgi:plasmid maintenance system antidote protein VapI
MSPEFWLNAQQAVDISEPIPLAGRVELRDKKGLEACRNSL